MNWRFLAQRLWLERTQWYSADRLRAWQERRWQKLLVHAMAHCRYYREAFAEYRDGAAGNLERLPLLPVLTRADVAQQPLAILADNAWRFRPHVGRTGGTSGRMLEFVRDRATVDVGNAVRARFAAWHGVRRGHRVAELRNMRTSTGTPDFQTLGAYSSSTSTLRLNLLVLRDPRRWSEVAAALAEFRPDVVRAGSTTALTYLSLYLLKHLQYAVRPFVVFVGGERVLPDQRATIAEAFKAPVVEQYGNWEYVVFAGECPQGRLHLAAEMGIVEILRAGRPAAPGEAGNVVVTNLWNFAFPFIRYAIDDVAWFESAPCPCGRGLPTWRIVGGRQKDLLATPDGYVHVPTSLVATPRWRGKVAGIRFYQETRTAVLAQVVKGPDFRPEDTDALRNEIREYLLGRLRVDVAFVDSLEQTAGGKFRSVISTVPVEV